MKDFMRLAPSSQINSWPKAQVIATFDSLTDPALAEYLATGSGGSTHAGVQITPSVALKNTAVLRCVSLISRSIGMLPLVIRDRETKEIIKDHPLARLMRRRPNVWQTPYLFRSMVQQQALTYGGGYCQIVRSGDRVIGLNPILGHRLQITQGADFGITYKIDGREVPSNSIFPIREALTENGFTGISRVKKAAEAIALAMSAERNASTAFSQGANLGGFITFQNTLTSEAYERMKDDIDSWHGPASANKWKLIEEGGTPKPAGPLGKDAQAIEQRSHQVTEIARAFEIPRPLLFLDETNWGSGVETLGQMFVMYTLRPWFESWEQAIEHWLMTNDEAERYEAKFDAAALLRGSPEAQAKFWSTVLGAGGHAPWGAVDEARAAFDWPSRAPAELAPQMGKDVPNESS